MSNKKIEDRYFSRRQFLFGAGSTLMLPPLLSLLPKEVLAQSTGGFTPQRLLMFYSRYGIHNQHLYPNVSSSQYTVETNVPFVRHLNLNTIPGDLSYVLGSYVNPYRSYLNMYQGLDLFDLFGHAESFFSGGIGTGGHEVYSSRSIDVILENAPEIKAAFKGRQAVVRWAPAEQQSWFRSNAFFTRPFKADGTLAEGIENTIYLGHEWRDGYLFNALFGGTTTTTSTVVDRENARKKLLVDKVLEDYQSLKSHRRISAKDVSILDQFIDGIHQVESQLQVTVPLACSTPNLQLQVPPTAKWGFNIPDSTKYWNNVAEMMAKAFQCDQSRAFALYYPWDGDHHHGTQEQQANGWTENYGDGTNYVTTNPQRNYLRDIVINQFVKKLYDTPDPIGGGNLLDNSLAIWCNEEGLGRGTHTHQSIPLMTFGKLGGQFKTGKLIDFRQQPHLSSTSTGYSSRRGYHIKRFLISVLRGLGVSQREIDRNGDGKGFASWPTDLYHAGQPWVKLRDFYPDEHFHTNHSKPLPFLDNGFKT